MKKLFVFAVAVMMTAVATYGAALTDNRNTPRADGAVYTYTQGSNVIYAGSIVCIDGSGLAVPGADATGYAMAGRAEVESDNTAANYSATKTNQVRRGTFRWENNASGFADADIGSYAYVFDDQTVAVAASNTYDIVAGTITDVDADGVWVDCLAAGGQGAASFTTLTASGNTAVGGTLGVTGNTTLSANATVGGTLANQAVALHKET